MGNWLLEGILELIRKLAEDFLQELGGSIVDPIIDFFVYTPVPLNNGAPAIFIQPDGSVWQQVYSSYLDHLAVGFLVLFVSYLGLNFWHSAGAPGYRSQKTKHGILTAVVVLPLGWPLGALILHVAKALTQLTQPSSQQLGELFLELLSVSAVAAGAPGINLFAWGMGAVDLFVLFLAGLLYALRIVFLFAVMEWLPLLLALAVVGPPVLGPISLTILRTAVKFAFLPVFVSMGLSVTATLVQASGSLGLTGLNALGALAQMLLALMIPVLTLVIFYLVLQSSFTQIAGRGANRALKSAKRRHGGTTVGETAVAKRTQDVTATAKDRATSKLRERAPTGRRSGPEFDPLAPSQTQAYSGPYRDRNESQAVESMMNQSIATTYPSEQQRRTVAEARLGIGRERRRQHREAYQE